MRTMSIKNSMRHGARKSDVLGSGGSLFGLLGSGVLVFFLLLPLLFVWGEGAQLEGVDTAFLGHLVAQQGVDHSVAGRLHLGLEGV